MRELFLAVILSNSMLPAAFAENLVSAETNDRALETLIENSATLKLEGDTSGSLAAELVKYITGSRDGVDLSNKCSRVMNAEILDCNLQYKLHLEDRLYVETINYKLDVNYDNKAKVITIKGMSDKTVTISKGS